VTENLLGQGQSETSQLDRGKYKNTLKSVKPRLGPAECFWT